MLEWEENLFLGLKALYQRLVVKPRQRRVEAVRATLAERRHSLALLGQMIAGRRLTVFETEDSVLCDSEHIFLPREFSLAVTLEANEEFYTLKTVLAALALRDGLTSGQESLLPQLPSRNREHLPHLEQRLIAFAAVLPAECSLWSLFGKISPNRPVEASSGFDLAGDSGQEADEATELQGSGQTEATVLPSQEDDGDGADLPTHTFEKVETLEEHRGQSRKTDAEDELQDHEEALRSLKMKNLLRSPERPASIYRSDVLLDGVSFETRDDTTADGLPYPEWDFRKRLYKPGWCRVKVSRATQPAPAWAQRVAQEHRSLILRLKRQFASLANEWLRRKRQFAGPEFDLDALVSFRTDLRGGHSPSEAIYLETRRSLHDLATVILLDKSYSTASYLENRRILDVILATVYCVGEVLVDYVEDFAVAGFASNTRRSCEFLLAKDFQDSWPQARTRLGSLEPVGYTRIGPALRHAQVLLHGLKASRKLILLITDGRPCDYDTYEGAYGIHDIKKAIETGQQHGIQTHALAIEKSARDYFPRMFPGGHYSIVSKPERLAGAMTKLYGRMTAG